MSKVYIKIVEVENCIVCPNRVNYVEGYAKVGCTLTDKEIICPFIPSWCPLPDKKVVMEAK